MSEQEKTYKIIVPTNANPIQTISVTPGDDGLVTVRTVIEARMETDSTFRAEMDGDGIHYQVNGAHAELDTPLEEGDVVAVGTKRVENGAR